jgi:hypothetical protein
MHKRAWRERVAKTVSPNALAQPFGICPSGRSRGLQGSPNCADATPGAPRRELARSRGRARDGGRSRVNGSAHAH